MNKRFLTIVILIFVISLTRLLTNYFSIFNFTPIAAMALFAGANFKDKRFSFIVPLAAMLVTDYILGFMPGGRGLHPDMIYIYLAFVLITFIGIWLTNRHRIQYIVGASLLSSILFFLITNFAVWPGNSSYTQDFSGLIDCYIAGLPFFGNTIGGDLFFCGVMFGSFNVLKATIPSLEEHKAQTANIK